ncbi:MAG: MGMT family protein, partial [Euryarchaeota archaeon]|nr:MGMT family protein [Euryarchaeota archaeon]
MKNIKERVLELTKKIPKGKVTTYGELAIAIGKPKAYRLIGKILSSNPCPNSIP